MAVIDVQIVLFFYKGKQFPICARCTGELTGMICAIFGCYFLINIHICVWVALLCPLIIDGVIQAKTKYESTNTRRVITGFFVWNSINDDIYCFNKILPNDRI